MNTEFLNRMKLGQKLGLISLAFVLPILLLSTLYAKRFYEDIQLANKELTGLAYLEKVWPVFFYAAKSTDINSGNELDPEAIKAVQDFDQTRAAEIGGTEEITTFLASFQVGGNRAQAMKSGLDAMIRVRDGSGLFIDPELDTAYMMDILTSKLPVALETVHSVDSGLQLLLHAKRTQNASANGLSSSIGQLQITFAPLKRSYENLVAASKDSNLGVTLEKQLKSFLATHQNYKLELSKMASNQMTGQLRESDSDTAQTKYLALITSVNDLYHVTLSEMRRLVQTRLDRLWQSALIWLVSVALSLAIAGALIFNAVKSIRDPVGTLVKVIDKLRAGDTKVAVEHVNDSNEIGEIARGLESFRTTVDELETARQQREHLQAEELKRAREISDLAFVINEVVGAAKEGDFTKRVPVTSQSGVMFSLSKGVNDLTETVDRGLSETVRMMSALASGDMTPRIDGEFKGNFRRLQTDANSMAEKFRTITRRISGVSQEVQSATREIASGVSDLSVRTEHQASSLQETTASMQELASTVAQNAINAQEANRVAAAARDAAVGGGDIAYRAVAAMSRIESSSKQISDIVGLIQDIAFQTNLLALNAAVEAARAGDAGKGFAVVANEVRALAQRAGQASKDIKQLIVNSDVEVREGVNLVKQAGNSLGDIVTSVKQVASLISEISAATLEQSTGIDQVSKAVSGMDQMTQQNAALVEETNAALHSAQGQVQELQEVVAFFKGVDEETGGKVSDRAGVLPGAVIAPTVRTEELSEKLRILAHKMTSPSAAPQALARGDWREF